MTPHFRALAFALLAPLLGFAQQDRQAAKVYRIGFVSPASPSPSSDAFRQGLRELGYVEGQNIVVEMRFAEGRLERLPELVADLLKMNVDVLAKALGLTIPQSLLQRADKVID